MTSPIKQLSLSELEDTVASIGLPAFRARQIASWLYEKGVSSYEEMTNLPLSMRQQLSEAFPLSAPEIVCSPVSCDGSKKYLLRFFDDVTAESVALPQSDGRLSVCVSSQAGCSMGCDFCATGKAGLKRSLYPGEIVDQVVTVQKDFNQHVTNVVVMGQGEPFANYNNTIEALRILNHAKLLNIGARHITVSTCGLIKGIRQFSNEPEQFTLAISLHSAIQTTRDAIMPGVASQKLDVLRNELTTYTNKTGRRFSFEYALMDSVNDSQRHLNALIDYAKGLLCHVNLIPLNEIDGSSYKPVKSHVLISWQNILSEAGISATIRKSRGSDIAGACGQLANTYK